MAVPWPTSASISMSFHWSPIARIAPSGTPSRRASQRIARPLDTPGATNSTKCGWLTITSARPANRARASGATAVGSGGSPTHMTFVTGCRIDGDQVVLQPSAATP